MIVLLSGYGYADGQEAKGTENLNYSLSSLPQRYDTLKQKDTQVITKQINYSLTIVRRAPDSVRYLLEDALGKSLHLKFNVGIATAYSDLGWVNTIEGKSRIAIKYYQKALPYALKGLRNRTSLAMFYACMGAPYFHLGLYDSMYFYSSKAENIVEGIKNQSAAEAIDVSSIYNNIGMLWGGVSNFNKALEYLIKAKGVLEVCKKNPEKLVMARANIISNIGLVYIELNKRDSAKYYLELSLQDDTSNPISLINLAKINIELHKDSIAEVLLKKAVRYTEISHDYSSSLFARSVLGIFYYQQKRYKESEPLLLGVIEGFERVGDEDLDHAYHAYKTLSDIKAMRGDYKTALMLEKKSLDLLDSMKVKEKMQSVYDLENKLLAANNDKINASNKLLLTQAKNRLQQRNFWIIAISLCFAVFIVLLIFVYRNNKTHRKLQQKELDDIQKEREINYLRAMIKGEEKERARLAREIHDGIMVQLSTIKMGMKVLPDFCKNVSAEVFFQTDYYRQLVTSMETATAELRSTAHNLMPDMLLQGGLSEALFYFCNTLRKNTDILIDYQQHGNIIGLDKEFELSIYRIIQELLQNVLKHAQATKVMLQVTFISENMLTVTIEDNGTGFDPAQKSNGMGLRSIQNRLKIMNGNMDIKSDSDSGTSIHIEFELIPFENATN
jgi:signal transduction histidine kinase